MANAFQISSDLVGLLQAFLQKEGVSFPDIDEALSRHTPGSRMPLEEWWSWLDLLDTRLQRPALGLQIGACLQLEHAGALGYLSSSCRTLAEVMQRYERFQRLLYDGAHSMLVAGDGWVGLRWMEGYDRVSPRSDEVLFAGMMTFMRMLVDTEGRRYKPAFIEFCWPAPENTQVYKEFFGAPVRFGQAFNTVATPLESLAWPVALRHPRARIGAEAQAEAMLGQLGSMETFLEKLQRVLTRALHEGEPTLEAMASAMAMSIRTFQRRLSEKHLTFRDVLQQTRLVLARHYLADPRLALNEISFLLGYSEQSAFQRAFRDWTGETPQQARRGLR
jgi:AraC-like DNA-binding protein